MNVESLGFDKDFLEFDEDDKEKILYSENPNAFINKKYEKVDFSRLDHLKFETNKQNNDFDLLDIDTEPINKGNLHPTYEQDKESDSESDSESKEYSDSGFGHTEEQQYSPFEDKVTAKEPQAPKKPIPAPDLDGFLDY